MHRHTNASDKNVSNDVANPLAYLDTFDDAMVSCLAGVPDYSADELRSCVYGEEGAELRKVSAAKTAADIDKGLPAVVWAQVDGRFVNAEDDEDDAHSAWKRQLVSAICSAYTGIPPKACSMEMVVV